MAAGVESKGDELYCPTCEQTFARGERCPADNTRLVRIAATRDHLIGRELDGRYTITEQLGAGGMGAVYRGTQHQLGREVAIKVVTPSLVKEPLVIKRFLREAKLASRLSHPNAVGVVDFGQTEDGLFFLVMELVNGRTLDDIVRDGKLAPARVVRIGAQICDALEGAHALQIIHRDLKPQNVMVMATGRDLVKVLDFGLAKSLSPEQGKTTMTNAGALLGTPAFMPPELVLGHECDARADLYSLGCILYVCASGRLPFPSDSVHEVIAMHATEPAKRIDGIPPRLWSVIDRLLQKDPAARYPNATATREALEKALERADTEEPVDPRASGSSTVLGWNSASGASTGKRARIATPAGVPKISVTPSGVRPGEAHLIASSATLPASSAMLPAASSAVLPAASSAMVSAAAASTAMPPAPTTAMSAPKGVGWKSIALVVAAGVAAAVVAFVVVDGASEPSPPVTPPPASSLTPPAIAAPEPTKAVEPPAAVEPAKAVEPPKIVEPKIIEPKIVEPKIVEPPLDAAPAAVAVEPPPVSPPPVAKVAKKPTVKKPKAVEKKPSEKKAIEEPVLRRPVKKNPGVL